jgi:hypothetical protein
MLSTQETISPISVVIAACLALLYFKFNSQANFFALSVAFFIANILDECSEALDSNNIS